MSVWLMHPRLFLGTKAPVVTPNSVDFSFLCLVVYADLQVNHAVAADSQNRPFSVTTWIVQEMCVRWQAQLSAFCPVCCTNVQSMIGL